MLTAALWLSEDYWRGDHPDDGVAQLAVCTSLRADLDETSESTEEHEHLIRSLRGLA